MVVLADLVAHRFCAGQLHHRLRAVLVGADEALVQGVEPPQLLLGAQAPMVDGSAHQGPVALLDVALDVLVLRARAGEPGVALAARRGRCRLTNSLRLPA